MIKNYKHIETKLIHSGEPDPRILGAVTMPIFQSAMYEYTGASAYYDIPYIRMNNTPNHQALHKKLAALENAEAALVTASGMSAITTALLSMLESGDHLLAQDCLYGGTLDFIIKEFAAFGISYDLIDARSPETWRSKLQPNTKAIYVETMTNPLLQVADLQAAVDFANKSGLVSIIDNTFATPINFRPAEWGFDLSLHSCTKYLNGHSDIVGGAVIGKEHLVQKITHKLNHLGGSMDPHACFLLHRGLKTLALRVRHQNQSALEIARFLEQHPVVSKVNYPGLESHADNKRAAEMFDGFSGMLSFELEEGLSGAERFLEKVKIAVVAPSLGGIETLVTRPATTSHLILPPEERMKAGISDSLIRVSTGIEATEEIIADFSQALSYQ